MILCSGAEFNPAIDLILNSLVLMASRMPLETGAIRSACETVIAICRSKNPNRLAYVSSLSAVQQLLTIFFNATSPSQHVYLGGGLSFDGFAALTETVSYYVHMSRQYPVLHQVSQYLSLSLSLSLTHYILHF